MPEKTKDRRQNMHKSGAGRLGAQIETHQPPPPPGSLLYRVATRVGEAFLGEGGMTL
jgi:hypothetical protein